MRSVLTALCLFASTAHAVPAQFTHQGRLLDADGVPLEGEATIKFRVTDSEEGGDELWEETITVPLTNGFYSAVLGASADNPLDTDVLSQAPVWLELQLDGEPAMFPRSAVNSVPYATMATVAEEVSGGPVDASEIAVAGSPVINDAGEWVGPAPTVNWSDIEGMPEDFADGIDDDTDTDSDSFAALGVSCIDGDIPVWDGIIGEWGCGIDAVLTADEVDAIVADNGYAMASEVFSTSFLDLVDVPEGLDDGDDNTQLSESEVDGMVADNGYAMATDVFSGSFTALTDVPEGLEDGDTTLSEDEVDSMVSDNGYAMVTDVDTEVAILLAEIETLQDQVATLEEDADSGGGTVMHGNYTAENSIELEALRGYTEITGNLTISPGSVPSLEMLSSLTTIGGTLNISSATALRNLDDLAALTSVGSLNIRSNSSLESLSGLSGLTEVSVVIIQDNYVLTDVALTGLTATGSNVLISGNASLTNLEGLNRLTTIGGYLQIQSTPLTSLTGLESLTEVEETLSIIYNHSLTSLSSLSNVHTVGRINLYDNPVLASLDGLEGITDAGTEVRIQYHTSLCQSSINDYVDALGSGGWSGSTYFLGNAGC